MDFTKDHKNKVNSLLMEKWGYGKKDEAIEEAEELEEMQGHTGKCCDMAHPDEAHEDYMSRITIRLAEELPDVSAASGEEEDFTAEPELEIGKSKVSGGEFKKASIETGKEGASGGFTSQERGVVKDLQKKHMAAAESGNVVSGKALRLAKLLAAELDVIVSKGK